jgi:2-polyprenyl-3-methyl-5-hydroxy-6-metoxy-1,4-benzoquinol methylase
MEETSTSREKNIYVKKDVYTDKDSHDASCAEIQEGEGNHHEQVIDVALKVERSDDQRISPKAEKGALSVFEEGIKVIDQLGIHFTGEQFIPGSGAEICLDHYNRYLFASQFITKDNVVLDLGCGAGYGSILFSQCAKKVYSFDRDQTCIHSLYYMVSKLGISNIETVCGSLSENLEESGLSAIPDDSIDVVICHEFIEHLNPEIQKILLQAIAKGGGPFKKNALLLMSTPEKVLYAKTRKDPNEFHLGEMNLYEFNHTVRESFEFSYLYSQNTVSANIVTPYILNESFETIKPAYDKHSVYYTRWLDEGRSIASVQEFSDTLGVYLYAVASNDINRINAILPYQSSILLDPVNKVSKENLSIAAYEMRGLTHKVATLSEDVKVYHDAREKEGVEYKALQSDLQDSKIREEGYRKQLSLQANKIQSLLTRVEELGLKMQELRELKSLREKVEQQDNQICILNQEISNYKKWFAMGQARLGSSFEEANMKLDLLYKYTQELGTPIHRIVSFFARRLGKRWPFTWIRKCMVIIYTIKKA